MVVKADWQNGDEFGADDANAVAAAVNSAEQVSAKGQPNGYASLDSAGLVPQAQLPITTADWDTLEGKPAVVAAGATQADARAAIGAEDASLKGQPDGYASLDGAGRIPVTQVPTGLLVDDVAVQGDSFQFLSDGQPVGDPVSLLIADLDGGSPSSTSIQSIDGGML